MMDFILFTIGVFPPLVVVYCLLVVVVVVCGNVIHFFDRTK